MLTLFSEAKKSIAQLKLDKTPTPEYHLGLNKIIITLKSILTSLEELPRLEFTEEERAFYSENIYEILLKTNPYWTVEKLKRHLRIDFDQLELKSLKSLLQKKITESESIESKSIDSIKEGLDLQQELIKIKRTYKEDTSSIRSLHLNVRHQYTVSRYNKQEGNLLLSPENKKELDQLEGHMKKLDKKCSSRPPCYETSTTLDKLIESCEPTLSEKEKKIQKLGFKILHVHFLKNPEGIKASALEEMLNSFFELLFSTSNPRLYYQLFSYMHYFRKVQSYLNHLDSINPERINPLFKSAYKNFYEYMETNDLLKDFYTRYQWALKIIEKELLEAESFDLHLPSFIRQISHQSGGFLNLILTPSFTPLDNHTIFVASEAELLSVSNIAESADEGEASANAGTDKRAKRERPQETATALATASASAAKPEDLESTYKRPRHSYFLRNTVKQEPEEGAAASHE